MNLHAPQRIQTQTELAMLGDIKKNIITPKDGSPVIKPVQDAVLGAYKMTHDDVKIEWDDLMNILVFTYNVDLENINIEKGKTYSGRDLFSYIIPKNIHMKNGDMIIQDSILKEGVMDKGLLGKIVYTSWDRYGPNETMDFIDNVQRIVVNWLYTEGFTVGIRDCIIPPDKIKKIYEEVEKKKLEVDHLITEIENNPELLDADTFEQSLKMNLASQKGDIQKIVMNTLDNNNNFYIMINSRAKGSKVNAMQIMGALGQDIFRRNRIQKDILNRTLPHFFQNDDRATARGYIEHSYFEGLSPQEFFFHHMTSREGLIDTAIKSVTGDTPIVILDHNGKTKNVKIGDWIDVQLDDDKNKDKIEHYKERDMELLKLKKSVYIPTTNEKGDVSWGLITAITRHDPGKELYEIKTHGGRRVIVTESKSLLIWNGKIFERKSTPEVKLGDYVPVTMKLAEPPVENKYIDVVNYLPKESYLYGTDFLKAKEELEKELEGKKRTKCGWWYDNNGKTFTLPYDHTHKLMRVIRRSHIENIKNDCVYPFGGKRTECSIPEKIELNRRNGKFIGLFLAEGNVCIGSGYVQITNNNQDIRDFVKSWFDDVSIKYYEKSKINSIGGTTSCVRGFSRVLAILLTKLVGHGARNKFVPEECFNAPEEFIVGLLDGYFSGDGTVTKNSLQVASASHELVTGINMLLSRLGIFGKMTITRMKSNNLGTKDIADVNMLSIRSQWAALFARKITLMDKDKQKKLDIMRSTSKHRNFAECSNTVLDEIIEINKIDVKKYPKVYDLTVPSTLNFGLANGLHVVDTGESGYISRRLMRALDDIGIKYDGLNRTGNGIVIQYVYGDNNLNQIKQRKVKFHTMKMGNKELTSKYSFTSKELKEVATKSKISASKLKTLNEKHVNELIGMRDQFRIIQRLSDLNYKTLTQSFQVPVNLVRIVNDIANNKYADDKKKYCDPEYILSQIDHILDPQTTKYLYMSQNEMADKDLIKLVDEKINKTLFRYSLLEYLSPKRVIYNYKCSKYKFDLIVQEIIQGFKEALVEPGEMVGCLGAEHMGEVATQMTLNSVEYNTDLLLKINGQLHKVKIGQFIDRYIDTSDVNKIEKHDNDTTLAHVKDGQTLEILSTDEDGNVSWKKIEAVTQHPPINEDGSNTLVHVKTQSGREVIATKAKSFLTLQNGKLLPTKGSDIHVGDYLPVYIKHNKNTDMKDILFDKIISIKECTSEYQYVYDLTVEDTRNFNLYNGLCMRDTFHATGSGSEGMQGIPRCEEIIGVKKDLKTPITRIYLNPDKRLDKDFANKLSSSISYTVLKDVVKDFFIAFDPDTNNTGFTRKDKVKNVFVADLKTVVNRKYDMMEWLIRIELDRNKMIEKNVTLLDIKTQFVKFWKFKTNHSKGLKKGEKVILSTVIGSAILSNYDNSEKPIIHIRVSLADLNYNLLINVQKWFFENIKLKGIKNIKKILEVPEELLVSFNNEDKEFEEDKEYVIVADGIDIVELRKLNSIDHNRSYCNDIRAIYKYYGVEAARSALIKELSSVYSEHSVSYHHIGLLVDFMTNTGKITSINRHGLNKLRRDTFAKASFETPIDQFLKAAIYNEVDTISNVSSQIITGRVITGGTGLAQLTLDTDLIENSEYIEDLSLGDRSSFMRLELNEILEDVMGKSIDGIFMPN